MSIRIARQRAWYTVATNQVQEFMADFATLGLAQPSSRKHQVSDQNEYWSLSRFGEELFKQRRRVRLIAATELDAPTGGDETPADPTDDASAPIG